MNKKFVSKMEKRLLQERSVMISNSSESQDIDADGDEQDEVQARLLLYISNQLINRSKEAILKIDRALEKIKNNVYGACEDCDEDIEEKRLEVNPYFNVCVKCAEIREKEQRKSR